MTVTRRAAKVRTTLGALEGEWNDGVAAFLGIPYAQPPVGELRWAPPVPAGPWDGKRMAQVAGPIAPQLASRLSAAMGPMQAPAQGEDCLSLNVWTPAPSTAERLPVLVFLHGGGYLSGAGSAGWYAGDVMARRGPAVVVTVNYRVGALGYLYLSPSMTGDDPVANLGLQDQRLALDWVKENIAGFGGDDEAITVFGQSAGAHSTLGLAAGSRAEDLFRRAILHSGPFGMPAATPERAERATAVFMEAAGIPGGGLDDLRALPVPVILDAQRHTLLETFVFGDPEPPFQLVVDGAVLREEPVARAMDGSLDGVDLLVGYTKNEATPFFVPEPALWELDGDALVGRVAAMRGEEPASRLRAYLERAPEKPAADAFCDLVSDEFFIAPTIELVERRAALGNAAHLWRFGWQPRAFQGRLGACHTLELPFVFNNFAAWTESPMLEAAPPALLAELGGQVQDAWLAFAATGNPNHDGLPGWKPHVAPERATMDFDGPCQVISDPSDGRRDLWT